MDNYLEELKLLQQTSDTEVAHWKADMILVEILLNLGYENIVNEYDKIKKWYA